MTIFKNFDSLHRTYVQQSVLLIYFILHVLIDETIRIKETKSQYK